MKLIYPDIYHTFSCTASACPDSCCQEWEVDVDDMSAEYYRSLPGDLGDALRSVLRDTEDGTVMTIQNRRCPMWQDDGLCRIQAALGHEALCKTCQEFPRLRHDYGDFAELGLELSCPEAARLLLTCPYEMQTQDVPGGEEPDYDIEAMRILQQSREVALTFMEESQLPVNLKLAVLLVYAHHTQNWLDGGDEAELNEAAALQLMETHANNGNWSLILTFFQQLEILTPRWSDRLARPEGSSIWHSGQTALMRYFILRHWLQSVADYDLIGRVKFMITACLLIHRLGADFVETAQLFSKEIENDQDNLDAILDAAYTESALTDINLLSLLKNS